MANEKHKRNDAQLAKTFQTEDDTGTPQTSPLTVSSSEIEIAVPTNAINFVYWVENYPIQISEVTGMARYTKVLAGGSDNIGCADMDSIFVKRDGASDATLHFRFNTV